MLKITICDSANELRLRLEGRLAGAWVGELRQCWRTASSTTALRDAVLDLRDVDFVDSDGQALLAEMHQEGVRLEAFGPLTQHLVEEIAGADCATFEGQAARRSDAFLRSDSPRRNSRAV